MTIDMWGSTRESNEQHSIEKENKNMHVVDKIKNEKHD